MRYDLIITELIAKSPLVSFVPKNIVEIGSRDGHDVNALKQIFNVTDNNCYIFEAHPDCYDQIKTTYSNFNVYNCAITNKTGPIKFNAGIIGVEGNVGISSVFDYKLGDFKSKEVEVDGWRFDDVCQHIELDQLDIVKIDVEGHSLEVLEGFGHMLQSTKLIQIELEHTEVWHNQATYDAVKQFFTSNGFIEVAHIRHSWCQSDSLWINDKYINKNT